MTALITGFNSSRQVFIKEKYPFVIINNYFSFSDVVENIVARTPIYIHIRYMEMLQNMFNILFNINTIRSDI